MTPKEVSKHLRLVQEKYKNTVPDTFEVNVSDMAMDAANAIDSLNTVESAITILTNALKEDKSEGSYYYIWQSSIACAIMDTFPKGEMTHALANEAAKRFLELLIKQ